MLSTVSSWIGFAAEWYASIYGFWWGKTGTSWSIWKVCGERHWFMLSEEKPNGCQCDCISRNMDGHFIWSDWNFCIGCYLFGLLPCEKVNTIQFFSISKYLDINFDTFLCPHSDTKINRNICWATIEIHRPNHWDQEHQYSQSQFMGHFEDLSLAVFNVLEKILLVIISIKRMNSIFEFYHHDWKF